jgi:hypothetical protein
MWCADRTELLAASVRCCITRSNGVTALAPATSAVILDAVCDAHRTPLWIVKSGLHAEAPVYQSAHPAGSIQREANTPRRAASSRDAQHLAGKSMKFQVLGPVALSASGRSVDLGHARQRAVLATLVVSAGRPVTPEELIDRVWDGSPPSGVRSTVYTYVTRLRRILESAHSAGTRAVELVREPGGYLLDIADDQVDMGTAGTRSPGGAGRARRGTAAAGPTGAGRHRVARGAGR